MLTYGKRKIQTLPSFSSLRDSSATSRSKRNASKKRDTSKPATLHGPVTSNTVSLNHDDSIDEMANMLLDDSTTVSDPAKRAQEKDLPHLPPPDDAWAKKTAHSVSAAGEMNEIKSLSQSFPPGEQMESQCFSSMELTETQFFKSIERSTPPIPRKSSKRKSVKPNTFTPPNGDESQAAMINAKVYAMMEATNTLKGNGPGKVHTGPYVPAKKRRLQGNKVIVKVRAAISDRINARSIKKRHDSVRDDHLLDRSLNELQDEEELSQYVSAMDIRLNEGDNLKNPKVSSLTGHGHITRKPVADDGRSIRSRKSFNTDPFSERPESSGITRIPTNFELSLKDDMSIDPSEEAIPDLPKSRPQSPQESLAQGKKLKGSRLAYDSESFDALFSSSPLAQSTPRLRLEPTMEENGRKTLKHVPADSRSLFDADASSIGTSDMDIDFPANNQTDKPVEDQVRRKSSFKDRGLFKRYSRKTKKHPSPSKAALEDLERALNEFPTFGTSRTLVTSEPSKAQEEVSHGVKAISSAQQVLAPKNSNTKVTEAGSCVEKKAGFGLFPKPELTKSGVSMPDITRRTAQKTMIPRPADPAPMRRRPELGESRFSLRNDVLNATAMDVDELQWNNSAYNIGR